MPEEVTQSTPEVTNSITLSRGQKGTYAYEAKVRYPMGTNPDQALHDLAYIDNKLCDKYPMVTQE